MKKIQKVFALLFIFMICLQGCKGSSNNINELPEPGVEIQRRPRGTRGKMKSGNANTRKTGTKVNHGGVAVRKNKQEQEMQQKAALAFGAHNRVSSQNDDTDESTDDTEEDFSEALENDIEKYL